MGDYFMVYNFQNMMGGRLQGMGEYGTTISFTRLSKLCKLMIN